MILLAILAIPSLAALAVMVIVFTRETMIGGREWKPSQTPKKHRGGANFGLPMLWR
jgi:hypothetical protein